MRAILFAAATCTIACAPSIRTRPSTQPIVARAGIVVVRDSAAASDAVAPVASAEPALDATSRSFANTIAQWVSLAAARCEQPLELVSITPARRVTSEERVWSTLATVRNTQSGATVTLVVWGYEPHYPAANWSDRLNTIEHITTLFALRAASDWLDRHPEVLAITRQHTMRITYLWSLTTASATVVCAHETPPHGPVIEGCWSEREAIEPARDDAFEYRSGGRFSLRGEYSLANATTVRVSIDEQGHVRRGQWAQARRATWSLQPVPSVNAPTVGPMAFLQARIDRTNSARVVLTLRNDYESMRCERTDRWRCEPIVPAP